MRNYWALVHKDDGSAFGISFPDIPGCFAAADEEADLFEAAQEALALYAQDETELPPPRASGEVHRDPAVRAELDAGAMLISVPLIQVARKARYNVVLDTELVKSVDETARLAGVSRSEYIAVALTDRLKADRGAVRLGGRSDAQKRKSG